MFVGSIYTSEGIDSWASVEIIERVLSRTETRVRDRDGEQVTITSYFYTLLCAVDGQTPREDVVEICEDDFQSEIISGTYSFHRRATAAYFRGR